MERFDPDGQPKRRAKKGETRCGECKAYRCANTGCQRSPFCRIARDGPPALCMWGICRADDYAGDCKHFTRRTTNV